MHSVGLLVYLLPEGRRENSWPVWDLIFLSTAEALNWRWWCWTADDLWCFNHSLQSLSVSSLAATPHWDAVTQHALNSGAAEGHQLFLLQSVSLQHSQKMHLLLSFFDCNNGVCCPAGEVLWDVHTAKVLKVETPSTLSPLIWRGACSAWCRVKSMISSLVLHVFRERLLAEHHIESCEGAISIF